MDAEGRLLGRLNLVDATVLVGALFAGVAAYHLLTEGNRVAPPFASEKNSAWRSVEIWLPPSRTFLKESLLPGALQRDPRTGEAIARIVGSRIVADTGLRVDMELWCQVDREGRVLYRSRLLLPGRELEIETESSVILGTVGRIGEPLAP